MSKPTRTILVSWGILILLVICLGALLLVAVFQFGFQNLRIKFAEGQLEVFDSMVEKASSSTNLTEIAGFLRYTHNYYPTGSKQNPGTSLDRIVERARNKSEVEIIKRLKLLSASNIGDDPDVWISRYPEP